MTSKWCGALLRPAAVTARSESDKAIQHFETPDWIASLTLAMTSERRVG
jgi:hypothetical protein